MFEWAYTMSRSFKIISKLALPGAAEPRAAVYLRCYPYDRWQLPVHRRALQRYADELGGGEPTVYFDNGRPASGPRPALEQLIRAVEDGQHHLVLVPGLWVFHLDDVLARMELEQLRARGCEVMVLSAVARR